MPFLPPLPRPGDAIAVVAPAGPAPAERITAGLEALEAMDFRPILLDLAPGPRHYLAGSDAHRARAVERAFTSPEFAAVWALRGGYGCIRTLEHLDLHLLRAHPKLLIGFSDLTAVLGAVLRDAGFAAVHGPVITQLPNLDPAARAHLQRLLRGEGPGLRLDPDRQVLKPGRVHAPLVGGNLSLLASLVGTPMMPRLQGILLLEDIGEPCYRVDRMLSQLRLSGSFQEVSGLLIGRFTGTANGEAQAFANLWEEVATWIQGPVVLGAPVGHGSDNHAVPLGLPACLDSDADEVTFSWAP